MDVQQTTIVYINTLATMVTTQVKNTIQEVLS